MAGLEYKFAQAAKTVNRLQAELKKIDETKMPDTQVRLFERQIATAQAKVDALSQKLAQIGSQRIDGVTFRGVNQIIDDTQAKLDALREQMAKAPAGTNPMSMLSATQTAEFSRLSDLLTEMQAKRQELIDSGGAFTLGTDTKDYRITASELEKAKAELSSATEAYRTAKADFDAKKAESYAGTSAELGRAQSEMRTLGTTITETKSEIEGLGRIRSISSVFGIIKQAGVSAFNGIKSGARSVVAGVSKIKGAAQNAFTGLKNGAKNAFNAVGKIVSGVKSVISKLHSPRPSSLLGLSKHSNSAGNAIGRLGHRIAGLAKRVFVFTMITKAFGAIRSAIASGIGSYIGWDQTLNASVNNLKSSLADLKANLGGAFAPIISAVVPILQTLVNWLLTAVDAIGAFIAAISGRTTYKSVVAGTAAAASDAAGALGDASGAAKDLKKELAGFDELTIIKSDDDSGSGGGGGGGGGAGGSGLQFVDKEIGSSIGDFANMLKQAWKNADFSDVGALIGEKLKDALDNIPWDKIQHTAGKIGQSLSTFINGAIEVDGLGTSIGNTLAQGINTAFKLFENAVKSLHWVSLGDFIKTTFMGLFNGINWTSISATLSEIGRGLGNFLNTINDPTLWLEAGETIRKGLDAILGGVKSFAFSWDGEKFGISVSALLSGILDGAKWEDAEATARELGADFMRAVNNIVTPENAAKLGTALGNLATTISTGLESALDEAEFEKWGESVHEFITSAIEKIPWTSIGRILGKLLKGAIRFVKGLIANWSETKQKIKDALKEFFTGLAEQVEFEDVAVILFTLLGVALLKKAVVGIGSAIFALASKVIGLKLIGIVAAGISGLTSTSLLIIGGAVGALLLAAFALPKLIEWMSDVDWDGLIDEITAKLQSVFDEAAKNVNVYNQLQTEFDKDSSTKPSTTGDNTQMEQVEQFLEKIEAAKKTVQEYYDLCDSIAKQGGGLIFGGTQEQYEDALDYLDKYGAKAEILQKMVDLFDKLKNGEINIGKFIIEQAALKKLDEDLENNPGTGHIKVFRPAPTATPVETDAKANITEVNDSKLTPAQKMLEGFQAGLRKISDLINGNDKTVDGIKGNMESLDTQKVPLTQRIVEGVKAIFNKTDPSQLTDEQKRLVGINAVYGKTDQSKLTDDNKTITGGKIIVGSANKDKLTADDKTVKNGKIQFDTSDKSKLSADSKTVKNGRIQLERVNQDKLTGAQKTVSGMTAEMSNPLVLFERTVGGMTAAMDYPYIGFDRTIGGMTAAMMYPYIGFARTVDGMIAYLVDRKKASSYNNYVDMIARLVDWADAIRNKIINFVLGLSKAAGGAFYTGGWHDIPQYAVGGAPTHGTAFVAGENGAEIVGTIGGRTEVLNKSQIASAIYSAVLAAMRTAGGQFVGRLNDIATGLAHRLDAMPEIISQYIPTNTTIPTTSAMTVNATVDIDYNRLADALSQRGGDYVFTAQLDGRTLFRETINQNNMYRKQTGHSAFA